MVEFFFFNNNFQVIALYCIFYTSVSQKKNFSSNMITGVAATGMVTHAASSAAGGLASKMILNYFTGINPTYNKESRRRMRYIQQKYAYAYGSGVHGEDACSIIQQIGNKYIKI